MSVFESMAIKEIKGFVAKVLHDHPNLPTILQKVEAAANGVVNVVKKVDPAVWAQAYAALKLTPADEAELKGALSVGSEALQMIETEAPEIAKLAGA